MKAKKWLGFLLTLAMVLSCVAALAACTFGPTEPGQNDDGDKVTVTYYDNRTILKSEQIEKGAKANEWTPEKEGYVFTGWYEEASLTNEFDFDKPITSDTNIFSRWRSENVEKDNRIWYVIGSMGASNWKFVGEKDDDGEWQIAEGYEALVFKPVEGKNNVLELTITLRPGMKFRFVTNLINSDWTGDETTAQVGLGNLKGFEYADGINPEGKGKVDCTAADKEYGVVKDANGKVVFEGGFEYNLPTNQWNIWPVEGSDGVYKFTLTTYPGSDENDTMDWECVEPLEALEDTHDMFIVGTIAGDHENWADTYDSAPKLTRDPDDQTLWKAFVSIDSSMYPTWSKNENPAGVPAAVFKVKNNISGLDYGVATDDSGKTLNQSGTAGAGNVFLTEGDYCITYKQETNIISFEKLEYYVVGTFIYNGATSDFNVIKGQSPKMTLEDGKYTVSVDIADVTSNSGYTWLKTQGGADVIAAIKVVYGSTLGIRDYYGVGENKDQNLFLKEAGEYTVTFDAASKTFSAEPAVPSYTVNWYGVLSDKEGDEKVVELKTESVKAGAKLTTWTPERAGYTFDNWYTEEALTNAYNFETEVSGALNLYAKLTRDEAVTLVTVTFMDATEEEPKELGTVDVTTGATSFEYEAPVKQGYAFDGWYTNKECTQKWENTAIDKALTLYGKYEKNVFTVSFYKVVFQGGKKVETHTLNYAQLFTPESVTKGDQVTKKIEDVKAVSALVTGWFIDADCTQRYDSQESTGITQDTTLYAKFEVAEEDGRDWYIVGEFGTEKTWNVNDVSTLNAKYKFVKAAKAVGEDGLTVFELTIDLYEGNNFKFVSNGYLFNPSQNRWDGSEMGYPALTWEGKNAEQDPVEKHPLFHKGDKVNDNDQNIFTEKNATYKITLHIDPAGANLPYETESGGKWTSVSVANNGKSFLEIELVKEITADQLSDLNYFITGNGAGDISNSGQFATFYDDMLEMTKSDKTDAEGYTTYTYNKIKIYEGDMFKIVTDNTPPEKDEEGNIVSSSPIWDGTDRGFESVKGGTGKANFQAESQSSNNITCKTGKSGVYNIIVKAKKGSENSAEITIDLVEPISTSKKDMGFYLLGDSTNAGWWDAGKDTAEKHEAYKLTDEDGDGVYEWTGELKAGKCKVAPIVRTIVGEESAGVHSDAVDWSRESTGGDKTTQAGTYKITYNSTTRAITVTKQ